MTPTWLVAEEACDVLRRRGRFRVQVLLREARAKRVPGAKKVSERRWLFHRETLEKLGR